jgi:hypothetical protein
MAFVTKVKDPADVLDFQIDWRATELPAGQIPVLAEDETITAATWTAYYLPAGANPQDPNFEWVETDDFNVDSDTFEDTTTTVWTSEGIRGAKYLLTCQIDTDQGRKFSRTIIIKMKEQ